MPRKGLEPLPLAGPDPKSGASTNFATLARWVRGRARNSTGPSRRSAPVASRKSGASRRESPDGLRQMAAADEAAQLGEGVNHRRQRDGEQSQQQSLVRSVFHKNNRGSLAMARGRWLGSLAEREGGLLTAATNRRGREEPRGKRNGVGHRKSLVVTTSSCMVKRELLYNCLGD